jgi:hypothetical protein
MGTLQKPVAFASFSPEHAEFPGFTELQSQKSRQTLHRAPKNPHFDFWNALNSGPTGSFQGLRRFGVSKLVDGTAKLLVLLPHSTFLSYFCYLNLQIIEAYHGGTSQRVGH